MNSKPDELAHTSVGMIEALVEIYRSTFVDRMQERFRLMTAGVYSIYLNAMAEGFDKTMRAHLADVLQDVQARGADLAETFGQELLSGLRLALTSPKAAPAEPEWFAEPSSVLETNPDREGKIGRFVEQTVAAMGVANAGVVVGADCAMLLGRSDLATMPPWRPERLFEAFSVALARVDVPIHAKVRLALYKIFADEVLAEYAEACKEFAAALPGIAREFSAHARREAPQNRSGLPPDAAADSGPRVAEPAEWPAQDVRGEGLISKLFRLLLFLMMAAGIVTAAWWLGGYLAGFQSFRFPSAEVRDKQTVTIEQRSAIPPAVSESLSEPDREAASGAPVSAQGASANGVRIPHGISGEELDELREKRRLLQAVTLKNFAWRLEEAEKIMVFELTVANSTDREIKDIEIVCAQYSNELSLVETGKTVLRERLEAKETKTFSGIVIGFGSSRTARVNCLISDLNVR